MMVAGAWDGAGRTTASTRWSRAGTLFDETTKSYRWIAKVSASELFAAFPTLALVALLSVRTPTLQSCLCAKITGINLAPHQIMLKAGWPRRQGFSKGYGTEEEIDGWDDCPRNHHSEGLFFEKQYTCLCEWLVKKQDT